MPASIVADATTEDKPESTEDAGDPAAVALGGKGGLKGGRARVAAEGLHRAPLVDTYRLHTVDVGTVTVRTGVLHEEPAELRVVVEQIEDVDGTADSTEPRIWVCPPAGWSEDYTADEAERLAALLLRAGRLTGNSVSTRQHRQARPGSGRRRGSRPPRP